MMKRFAECAAEGALLRPTIGAPQQGTCSLRMASVDPGRTSNIEHRTSNIEWGNAGAPAMVAVADPVLPNVRRWTFSVRCSMFVPVLPKERRPLRAVFLLGMLIVALQGRVAAQESGPEAGSAIPGTSPPVAVSAPKAPGKVGKIPQFGRLPNGDIRLGHVTVHRERREISFPAKVNLASGNLDLAISTDVGRLYESLLRTDVQPLHLQTLMYLLRLKNGPRFKREDGKQGDLLDIELEYADGEGNTVREPIEQWMCDERTGKPMTRYGWVFVGSDIRDGSFLAEVEGNVVVTYSCGATVLDIPDEGGNKAWTFYVNPEKSEPGKDADVRVILIPRERQP